LSIIIVYLITKTPNVLTRFLHTKDIVLHRLESL